MLGIAVCATAASTSENQMALHDYCHASSLLGTDNILGVILRCSTLQFVQQHAARLRIRWPSVASVMLPVYLAMTSVLDVILQCSASQFVRQHLAHQRVFPGNDIIPDVILQCSASICNNTRLI